MLLNMDTILNLLFSLIIILTGYLTIFRPKRSVQYIPAITCHELIDARLALNSVAIEQN